MEGCRIRDAASLLSIGWVLDDAAIVNAARLICGMCVCRASVPTHFPRALSPRNARRASQPANRAVPRRLAPPFPGRFCATTTTRSSGPCLAVPRPATHGPVVANLTHPVETLREPDGMALLLCRSVNFFRITVNVGNCFFSSHNGIVHTEN